MFHIGDKVRFKPPDELPVQMDRLPEFWKELYYSNLSEVFTVISNPGVFSCKLSYRSNYVFPETVPYDFLMKYEEEHAVKDNEFISIMFDKE